MKTTFVNTTGSQLVVDDEGRILGGHEWGDYEKTDWIKRWVDAGYLVEIEKAPKNAPKSIPDTSSKDNEAAVIKGQEEEDVITPLTVTTETL